MDLLWAKQLILKTASQSYPWKQIRKLRPKPCQTKVTAWTTSSGKGEQSGPRDPALPDLMHNVKSLGHRFLRSPERQPSALLCLQTNLARTIHTSL